MAVQPIPAGYHTVTPYLVVEDARSVLEFARAAFDAEELFRMDGPDGRIAHAEIRIGDSVVMMGQAGEGVPPMPAMLHLYVEDVDTVYAQAVRAGGESVREPTNEFYGDRTAGVKDSSGNQWWIATHVEDVPPEELAERAAAAGR